MKTTGLYVTDTFIGLFTYFVTKTVNVIRPPNPNWWSAVIVPVKMPQKKNWSPDQFSIN